MRGPYLRMIATCTGQLTNWRRLLSLVHTEIEPDLRDNGLTQSIKPTAP